MKDKPLLSDDVPVKPRKKASIFVRFLAFLMTLLLVSGAVTLVVYRDKLNFDALLRAFTYRSLNKGDSGQVESFTFESSVYDAFISAGENLLLCSPSGVCLYSGDGTVYVEQHATFTNPVVDAAGMWSLAWDTGGSTAFVFHGKELAYSLTMEQGKTLLSARINASGYLACVTQSAGYKGSVTVYAPSGAHILQINLSSSFIMDALVTADNETLSIITVGEGSGLFESRLGLYALKRTVEQTEPDATLVLGTSAVLDFRENEQGYWTLGDQDLVLSGHDATHLGTYDYGERYLKEFSLGGDNFAVLLLGKYRAGTLADLVTVDAKGKLISSLSTNEQLLSLSAAGRYIAVLTADRLDIYTSDLELYDSLEGTHGAQTVLMRADGTAMLITQNAARLYIPS